MGICLSADIRPAVPDQPVEVTRLGENRLDLGVVLGVQADVETAGIVRPMVGYAQPRADDHPGDGRTVQDIAHGDVGEADPMLVGDAFETPSSSWNSPQPPQASTICLYLCRLAVVRAPRLGSGCPRYASESSPPPRVP